MFSLAINHTDGNARIGVFDTPHGRVETPAFMPVGTAGTVKGVLPGQLRGLGAQMILANTYHLQLRPTADVVRDLGGLHRFTGWDGPILTDSGGYQVFSLAQLRSIDDEGVVFQSHIDGATLRLDPAIAIDVQQKLGADVIMAFDQCPALPSDVETLKVAVDRTVRWAHRCRQAHQRSDQALFGIVQGGLDANLRHRCADELVAIGFEGYAVGGLSVGESHAEMVKVLQLLTPALPGHRPRYLMGVGLPGDILAAVRTGIDLFDCTLPTRNGRNSHVFTARGILKMRNRCHQVDDEPLERGCDCEACVRHSRGYIRHLFNTGEMLGPILASMHNIRFYQRFMDGIRTRIGERRLDTIEEEFPIAAVNSGQEIKKEC